MPSSSHSPELDFETHAAFMPPKSRARTGEGRVQKETGVRSVAKPHQRTTRQRKNDSGAVLGRPTAQAPNTKSTKKAKKAAPIAVSVPGALIRSFEVNPSTS